MTGPPGPLVEQAVAEDLEAGERAARQEEGEAADEIEPDRERLARPRERRDVRRLDKIGRVGLERLVGTAACGEFRLGVLVAHGLALVGRADT